MTKRRAKDDWGIDSLKNHLLSKRKINGECWEWTGGKTSKSKGKFQYGIIKIAGRKIRVPRLSMYLWKGFALESKLFICHTCDNTICFNPEHLFVGTNKNNIEDMLEKGRAVGGAEQFVHVQCEHR